MRNEYGEASRVLFDTAEDYKSSTRTMVACIVATTETENPLIWDVILDNIETIMTQEGRSDLKKFIKEAVHINIVYFKEVTADTVGFQSEKMQEWIPFAHFVVSGTTYAMCTWDSMNVTKFTDRQNTLHYNRKFNRHKCVSFLRDDHNYGTTALLNLKKFIRDSRVPLMLSDDETFLARAAIDYINTYRIQGEEATSVTKEQERFHYLAKL